MKTKDKAALLAEFDRSPGSIWDRPGVLRGMCEEQPEALAVLAAIEAGSPAETVRKAIVALPVDDAPAPGAVTAKTRKTRKRKKAK